MTETRKACASPAEADMQERFRKEHRQTQEPKPAAAAEPSPFEQLSKEFSEESL